MFNIEFLIGPTIDVGDRLATITLGRHVETFSAPVGFWSTADYQHQWWESAQRFVAGAERSAFLVSVADPAVVELYRWWPAWRENDSVYVQEQIVLLGELGEPFDLTNPYRHIRDRRQIGEGGHRISEWRVQIEDMNDFVARHSDRKVTA